MKYYVYISDTKVDMLLPQVPHDVKKKVALELKMDLKLLSASRKTETESEDSRIARLETVADFIREYGKVGSVDQPDEYIQDCMALRWGDYGWDREDKSPVVYFGGQTSRTIVGLGGSSRHVIGNQGESSAHSHSATPFLIKFLAKELSLEVSKKLEKAEKDLTLYYRKVYKLEFNPLRAVELATRQMTGPEQKLEFLAKKLMYGPVEINLFHEEKKYKNVLLATPLYWLWRIENQEAKATPMYLIEARYITGSRRELRNPSFELKSADNAPSSLQKCGRQSGSRGVAEFVPKNTTPSIYNRVRR